MEKFRRTTFEAKHNDHKDDGLEEESASEQEENNRSAAPASGADFEGIRFAPKAIEFADAFEGKQFSVKMQIQNVGRNPVRIKVGEPNSFIFQLKKPIRRDKLLASGSSVTRTITYCYHNDHMVQRSQIPIQVNGHLVDYPIVVMKARPDIQVQPQKLDFERINIGDSPKTLVLSVRNAGSRRTRFEIDLGKNDLGLVVTPRRGTVRPMEEAKVAVDMMGTTEGEFYKELWLTSSAVPIRIPVLVEVVRSRLNVAYPKGTRDFHLIDFRPTFRGTQAAESFVVENHSAEMTFFNVLAEVDGKLQFMKDARKARDTFDMFFLTTENGRLKPFERRIVTVVFRPRPKKKKKGWHREGNENKNEDSIEFLRVNRVDFIERKVSAKAKPMSTETFNHHKEERSGSIMQASASVSVSVSVDQTLNFGRSDCLLDCLESESMGKINAFLDPAALPEETVLRLCLHGKAVDPYFPVQPDSFQLEGGEVGEQKKRVLKVANGNPIPAKFKFLKSTSVKVTPWEGWLSPGEAREILVSLTPCCAGKFNVNLEITFLGKSDVVFGSDESLKIIAKVAVPLSYEAHYKPKHLEPKIGVGISHHVGSEWVTFKEAFKLPFSATILGLRKKTRPAWMKRENADDVLVALPNVRPRTLHWWPKERICRTIFSGLLRYAPPEDITLTLIKEELKEKKRQRTLWDEYLALARKTAGRHLDSRRPEDALFDCRISCGKQPGAAEYKPDPTFVSRRKANATEDEAVRHQTTLVPLSPMFLSVISVEPRFINFHKVAVNTPAEESLFVRNLNPFAISVHFVSGKSGISIPESDTVVVDSLATKSVKIRFCSKDLGRYYGFLDYVVNGSHEFNVVVSAFVTPKMLEVNPLGTDRHSVELPRWPPKTAFQPRTVFVSLENCLQVPVKYRWIIPEDSPLFAKLPAGEVPPRFNLLAEFFLVDHPNASYVEVNLIAESGSFATLKCLHRPQKVNVRFLAARINMGDVSLNLPTTARPVIHNGCYHDVSFEILDWDPTPGVAVTPRAGVVRARSFFPLEVTVRIPVVMKFSFEVVLFVHMVTKISCKISGRVVVPVIRLRPSEIVLRKICAQSFDTALVCAENAGTVPARLAIDFGDSSEYSVADGPDKVFLPPGKSKKFTLRFEPKDVARHVFYLPLIVNDILGPPMMQESGSEFVSHYISGLEEQYLPYGTVCPSQDSDVKISVLPVNSTVTPSLLRISPLNVHFQETDACYSKFQPRIVVFSNDSGAEEVTFCIRNDDLGKEKESPFDLLPLDRGSVEHRARSLKASLRRGETLAFEATFRPKKPGAFEVEVPVFVRGYNEGIVYNYIRMKGELRKPRLHPEATEIHFPPVPLGVSCDVPLAVSAVNYVIPERVRWVFCNSEGQGVPDREGLAVTWLTQPLILAERQVLQCRVAFQSSLPVALRGHLLFFDSRAECCSVLVTATADNSAITTHSFLATRSFWYRLIRDSPPVPRHEEEVVLAYPVSKVQLISADGKEEETTSPAVLGREDPAEDEGAQKGACLDKGPRLVVLETKSTGKCTRLPFASVVRNSPACTAEDNCSTARGSDQDKAHGNRRRNSGSINSVPGVSQEGSSGVPSLAPPGKAEDAADDVTYPCFPPPETLYGKHFHDTLAHVERWIFEVVMRCDQRLTIPGSFQRVREPSDKSGESGNWTEKDFLDFLAEIVGPDPDLPKRVSFRGHESPSERASLLHLFFVSVLLFLQNRGCFLPHVKPEYLLAYEHYAAHTASGPIAELSEWGVPDSDEKPSRDPRPSYQGIPRSKSEKEVQKDPSSFTFPRALSDKSLLELYSDVELYRSQERKSEEAENPVSQAESGPLRHSLGVGQFVHEYQTLDKNVFESRSTQAWLDVVLQIFRNFVLTRILYGSTVPRVAICDTTHKLAIEVAESCSLSNSAAAKDALPQSNDSNLYSTQERVLLSWLNRHLDSQKDILWRHKTLPRKIVDNFDADLQDSIALLSVTASHCPYVVSGFLQDVFHAPETPDQMYHNAGRLVVAWRELNVGLTVETSDLVSPNAVFMILLVAQLYHVLPSLHPRSLVCFSAPLTSDTTRVIQIKNNSSERVCFEGKFLAEDTDLFALKNSSLIEVQPFKTKEVRVNYWAKKIKKASTTLILDGRVLSPSFARHLTFYLEGEPSGLQESERFSISVPLHEVICTEIPVRPPYPEPTTYRICYTTGIPRYDENVHVSAFVKPWSDIRSRKLSRRLFLHKSEVTTDEEEASVTLGLTVGCLTKEDRSFRLLFTSPAVGDFIVAIHTRVKPPLSPVSVTGFYSESWSPTTECLCNDGTTRSEGRGVHSECPLFTRLEIPKRNEALWHALQTTFFKSLLPQEKPFWTEHFETNIGLRLILWLMSPEEEEEVVDEFVHVIATRVSYALAVEPPNDRYVTLPERIDISDVREKSHVAVPVHVSNEAPPQLNLVLTMTSESGREVRRFQAFLQTPGRRSEARDDVEEHRCHRLPENSEPGDKKNRKGTKGDHFRKKSSSEFS